LAISVGTGLEGLGDQPSGRLELPPRESGYQMLPGDSGENIEMPAFTQGRHLR